MRDAKNCVLLCPQDPAGGPTWAKPKGHREPLRSTEGHRVFYIVDLLPSLNIRPFSDFFRTDGTWFKEGYGVDPDIAVPEDLGAMAKGVDPQLERAIQETKKLMKEKGYKKPERPSMEKKAY